MRRIPHVWIVPTGFLGQGGELAKARKGVIPVVQTPNGQYWADSTPIILELERLVPGQRSLLPDDPADRFLALLIEDFADEWLPLQLFDMRWAAEPDISWCSRRQMAGWLGAMPAKEFDAFVNQFQNRQTGLLARLGDPELNRPVLRDTYVELLAAMEAQLSHSRFLFGSRPSIADIGIYGQLSQMAIDPTASAIMRKGFVRLFQWVQDMDDASGIEGDWRKADEALGPGTTSLLNLIGQIYLPFLVANAAAIAKDEPKFRVTLRGREFEATTNTYKGKCLNNLKLHLAEAMDAGAGERLEKLLKHHGCWDVLLLDKGEREKLTLLRPDLTEPGSGPFGGFVRL